MSFIEFCQIMGFTNSKAFKWNKMGIGTRLVTGKGFFVVVALVSVFVIPCREIRSNNTLSTQPTTPDACVVATNLLQTELPCSRNSWHGENLPSPRNLRARNLQTYVPGRLTVNYNNGLELSKGLQARVIARTGERVRYKNGRRSRINFHARPDGAAVIERPGGGWVYVSNAESRKSGGVGALTFDSRGRVTNYEMILKGTTRNCQGGVTPWNTFVSCEENDRRGQCWETDPLGKRRARKTKLGGRGGNYEAVAVDNRNRYKPRFFVTNDKDSGEIRRFTPNRSVARDALNGGDPWDILSTPGEMHYLIIEPQNRQKTRGTFSWSSSLSSGKRSAAKYFKRGTYKVTSTQSRRFSGKPDGLITKTESLYISEEPTKSGSAGAGVYGYDFKGNFVTILDSKKLRGDATGVAFSPDKRRMYFAIQRDGQVFEVTRRDGGRFDAM